MNYWMIVRKLDDMIMPVWASEPNKQPMLFTSYLDARDYAKSKYGVDTVYVCPLISIGDDRLIDIHFQPIWR